MSNNQKRILK